MRDLTDLDPYRDRSSWVLNLYGTYGDGSCGVFRLPSDDDGQPLTTIAAVGLGWDHVSVSRADRIPTWSEMDQVKRLFFLDTETAMQLHVPAAEHINTHSRTLHLWRPTEADIPRPPSQFV